MISTDNITLSSFALTGTSSNFITSGASISLPTFDITISQTGLTSTSNYLQSNKYQQADCTNNTILQGDTNRSIAFPANGDYRVILSKRGCTDTSACFTAVGVGINESNFNDQFSLSQNPTEETFQLINSGHAKINALIKNTTSQLINISKMHLKSRFYLTCQKLPLGYIFHQLME